MGVRQDVGRRLTGATDPSFVLLSAATVMLAVAELLTVVEAAPSERPISKVLFSIGLAAGARDLTVMDRVNIQQARIVAAVSLHRSST